jgi:type IV pilus assembly protein PilA
MKRSEKGFTLIELLVVIAIIGILAAIAIPQFAEYRKRGFDSRAKSDLRNVATAEEAYFVDYERYITCADAAACQTALPGVSQLSQGVVLSMTAASATSTFFTGSSNHPKGTSTFTWNSGNGGLQP